MSSPASTIGPAMLCDQSWYSLRGSDTILARRTDLPALTCSRSV